MRRKSERNKAKGSPEKKVEKPTRRTTRRRGKASPSTSPERENTDDNVSSTPYSDDEKESRLQPEEQDNDHEQLRKEISSSELIKSVLGEGEEDNGSVWKVARADASPGEIQKLKLCRQRNISEASDSSLSKKKSNKWPDSDEGGVEGADSADEQISSSQKMFIGKQTDDASSSHPGQDSNEEVSDYKENLPEIASANLSDDKTNIDQLADSKENLPETTATNLSEPPSYEDNKSSHSTNLPGDNSHLDQSLVCRENVAEFIKENLVNDQSNQDSQENLNIPAEHNSTITESQQQSHSIDKPSRNDEHFNKVIPTEKDEQINQEAIVIKSTKFNVDDSAEVIVPEQNISEHEVPQSEKTKIDSVLNSNKIVEIGNTKKLKNEDEEEGEIVEDKEPSPEADSASCTTQSLGTQDAHHKYHESSLRSGTPELEAEPKKKKKGAETKEADSSNAEASSKRKSSRKDKKNDNQKSPKESEKNSVSSNSKSEIELSECNIEKEDILEISEKSDELNVISNSKPVKVSLKRSFSTRLSTDSETKKEENIKKPIANECNQNKENHADNEQPDQKSSTKRRRWGMTTTTDIAPAFSISTDSLKALVPGAKPLSVNEVRLTKDEDDEREHRKSKIQNSGDHKSKYDTVANNEVNKKGEAKNDNHLTSRRKITVLKETPRPKSPSPPEAQATNILLIRNLVRPFTLNQIKELLSRTGTIAENGFWMDRIKSKCFVEYANEDQAFETRQALHGVSWPLSNPKKLIVEYSTKEDMDIARETVKDQPANQRKVEQPTVATPEVWKKFHWQRDEKNAAGNKITVIREWDLGKEDGQLHVKEKERGERKEFEKKKRQRSRSPAIEAHLPAPARKFKKKEEEPPTAKLLDDLFRKTKATPCIYWLPLTNEQIIVKEEMRRQHMAEHARRLEEMRRAERNRDTRRRRSPRK